MARPAPQLARKSSKPWNRLKPVKQDSLELMGYVSKGDTKLLDPKTQELFYRQIVTRYMQVCAEQGRKLDSAFDAWAVGRKDSPQSVGATTGPSAPSDFSSDALSSGLIASRSSAIPATEISIILTALRKLREGLLATSSKSLSPEFSQRVHVFNIRVAILVHDAPSYHPSLTYLLKVLHTSHHPLPKSELAEMTTYAILDHALRQNDCVAAYQLKYQSKEAFGYKNSLIDALLRAVVANNWVEFWRIRKHVDGYMRALMDCHQDSLRKTTLKAFGRAYLKVDLGWLLDSAAGAEMSWEELVEKEKIGWQRDLNTVTIRKPRAR